VGCHTPYGTDIGAAGADGDDTIRALDPVVLRAVGGRGADGLSGNASNDYLNGVGRSDVLKGRAGKDRLFAGPGRDLVYGGGGNDFLWALDDDRDRVIDCGRGNDRAFIDRHLDPEPIRCEHVHFGRKGD
jgi:Ca2+-binding RTX toxin-like protein